MWATFNQPKISTQKTKKVNNTQPTKNHNTENEKCEQHSTNQKLQHRKLKKVSNTQPTKHYNTEN